ncbi:MAG: DUF4405 domain-containing protein [Desulfosporosinus sp.]|nr:DUF4405 domain-containing protein [Desulfosporosinus sp.]
MKTINYFKLALDIVLLGVFALLFNMRVFGGLRFHEIAGLALGGAFVVHLALKTKWIKQVTANLLSPKLAWRIKIGYLVDVLLLLAMGFIIVSGIMISRTILVDVFKASNRHLFQNLHRDVAYSSLVLIGIHLGFNWAWVRNTCQQFFGVVRKSRTIRIMGIVVGLALSFGCYTIYTGDFETKAPIIQSSVNNAQGLGDDSGLKGTLSKGKGQGEGHLARRRNGAVGESAFDSLLTPLAIVSVFSVATFCALKLINN